MEKKKIIFIIIFAIALGLAYYGGYVSYVKPSGRDEEKKSSVSVFTSFYPLYDFTKTIGGDLIQVKNITPAGAEPHDYEPTPREVAQIYSADLFIFNGLGLDPWAEKIKPELERKGVITINMSESLKDELAATKIAAGDPHFWLDPVLAQAQADIIAEALMKIDPSHKIQYGLAKDQFKIKLAELNDNYRRFLENCRLNELVVSHRAFSYLAGRFGLKEIYISGFSPDQEPSAGKIAEISRLAKEKNIRYIFFETLVSPKLAKTIANEIGARTLVLNPLEGLTKDQIESGENYLSVMEKNLVNLEKALECQ